MRGCATPHCDARAAGVLRRPRSVGHCPRTDTETAVLLFEPSTVINTRDTGGDLTVEVDELT
jgi:hypothetical protein